VACGVWRVACGVWRVACGVWRVACGVWRVACGDHSVHTALFFVHSLTEQRAKKGTSTPFQPSSFSSVMSLYGYGKNETHWRKAGRGHHQQPSFPPGTAVFLSLMCIE
jgi:hypothetical protein